MKIFSSNSRFSYGILLVMLVVSITGTFFSLHNQITQTQAKTPFLAVLFTLASIVFAFLIFQELSSSIKRLNSSNGELAQLKKTIQESQRSKEKAEALKNESKQETIVDYEKEAKSFLPQGKFESEEKFLEKLLSNIAKKQDIVQSIAFKKNLETGKFEMVASYAYFSESETPTFAEGESLPGQVAKNQMVLALSEVPEDYITVVSGLGKGSPKHLLIVPVIDSTKATVGVLEFASFAEFSNIQVKIFEALGLLLEEQINTIGNSTEE